MKRCCLLSVVLFSVLSVPLLLLAGCAAAPAIREDAAVPQSRQPEKTPVHIPLPPPDGVYAYDGEYFMDNLDFLAGMESMGIRGTQTMRKVFRGYAVLVQDGRFREPETGFLLEVREDGSVFSPENGTIQGSLEPDGRMFFFGVRKDNGQSVMQEVRVQLAPSAAEDRAGAVFNGVYRAKDSGSGRAQVVTVQDGLYLWQYETPQEGDFLPWPVIVQPDGTCRTSFSMTTQLHMEGVSDQLFFTEFSSEGKIHPDGVVVQNSLTITNGTGMNENRVPDTMEAVRVTSEDRSGGAEDSVFPDHIARPEETEPEPAVRMPDWYAELLAVEPERFVSCGMKIHADPDFAFRIAESVAAGKIASYLRLQVKSRTEMASFSGEGAPADTLSEVIETAAAASLSYRVTERFYDEKSGAAFVKIESDRE